MVRSMLRRQGSSEANSVMKMAVNTSNPHMLGILLQILLLTRSVGTSLAFSSLPSVAAPSRASSGLHMTIEPTTGSRTWVQQASPLDIESRNINQRVAGSNDPVVVNRQRFPQRPLTGSQATILPPPPALIPPRNRAKMQPMPVTGYNSLAIEEHYDRRPFQVGWRLNSLGFPLLGKLWLWYSSAVCYVCIQQVCTS
jgi:hypothetical protein